MNTALRKANKSLKKKKDSRNCPHKFNYGLLLKAVFYYSWTMRMTREDLIILGEEDSSTITQEHTHPVAASQGLQGPEVLDYWLDLFFNLHV